MSEARLQIPAAPYAAVAALERELGCSNVVAQVLVRRGLAEPESARAWLAGAERHARTTSAAWRMPPPRSWAT